MMVESKKRKFSRIHFDRHVKLDFSDGSFDACRINDLSLTGMFVIGFFKQNVGENCIVNLFQKGISSNLSLQASAKVARRNDEGIAIEFTSMSFDSYMFLQVTLLYEAEEPLSIGLELPDNCPFEISDRD